MDAPELQTDPQNDGNGADDSLTWPQLIGGTILALLVVSVVVATIAYIVEVGWARTLLDGFWDIFDEGIEWLKVLAALLPLLVVVVAFPAYRSEQWWKRAQWALDTANGGTVDGASRGRRQ